MSMIEGTGIIRIGLASVGASVHQFTEFSGRYFLGFVNEFGRAVIYQSVNHGMTWIKSYDLGLAQGIAIRGDIACVRSPSNFISGISLATGNYVFGLNGNLLTGQGGKVIAQPVPLPEMAGGRFGDYPISWPVTLPFGGTAHYVKNTAGGKPEAPLPAPLLYMGSRGFGFGEESPLMAYFTYTDPFFESNTYPSYAVLSGQPDLNTQVAWRIWTDTRSGYPKRLESTDEWAREAAMEGMVNDQGFGGVSVRGTHQIVSSFLRADHWSGHDHDQSPIYIPDLRAPGYVKVPATPSGVARDSTNQRGAVQGFVNGVKRIGMIEPGAGFAHARLDGEGRGVRKYLGNLGAGFGKQRLIMPFNNPTFGMCMFAQTHRVRNALEVLWIYDRKPDEIPTNVRVKDGKYEDRTDDDMPRAKVLSSQYTRW